MEYAVIGSGAIVGWILVEFIFAAVRARAPFLFNIGFAFVGGVVAKLMHGG